MRPRAYILGLLLGVVGCTRVPAAVEVPPSEPAAASSKPTPTDSPSQERWYGDLQLTARELVEPPEPRYDAGSLPPPTAEELAAWDRKSYEAEAPLHEWDRAHIDALSSWWRELQCLHLALTSVGNSTFNSNDGARWQSFAGMFKLAVDGWITDVLSAEPELFGNSKAFASLLEAHELLSSNYPKAYEAGDAWELQVSDERWNFVVNRLDLYLPKVGAVQVALDRENPDDLAACRTFLDSL